MVSIVYCCVTYEPLKKVLSGQNGDTVQYPNFPQFLADVGNGNFPYHLELGPNIVQIHNEFIFDLSTGPADFLQWYYPDIELESNFVDISTNAIIAPANYAMNMANQLAIRYYERKYQ